MRLLLNDWLHYINEYEVPEGGEADEAMWQHRFGAKESALGAVYKMCQLMKLLAQLDKEYEEVAARRKEESPAMSEQEWEMLVRALERKQEVKEQKKAR